MWPHGKPVSEMTYGRMVVESLWLQWPVAAGCGKPVAALGATYGLRERPLQTKGAKQTKCRQLPPQHRQVFRSCKLDSTANLRTGVACERATDTSFYAPFRAGSADVRFHTPLGVTSPARPVEGSTSYSGRLVG